MDSYIIEDVICGLLEMKLKCWRVKILLSLAFFVSRNVGASNLQSISSRPKLHFSCGGDGVDWRGLGDIHGNVLYMVIYDKSWICDPEEISVYCMDAQLHKKTC